MANHSDESRPGTDAESFESERTATRAETAALFRGLADGVDAGLVRLGADDDAVTASLPAEMDLEVEYERDDEAAELEVELEWTVADEPERERPAVEDGDAATESTTVEPSDSPAAETDEGHADADRPAVETATVESGGSDGSGAGTTDADAGPDGTEASAAAVVGAAAPVSSQARFEVFRDRRGGWRWRLVHRNGNVIATSGDSYTRKHNARKGLRSVMANADGAVVVDEN